MTLTFNPLDDFSHLLWCFVLSGFMNYLTNGNKLIKAIASKKPLDAIAAARILFIDIVTGVITGVFVTVYIVAAPSWDDSRGLGFVVSVLAAVSAPFLIKTYKAVTSSYAFPLADGLLSRFLEKKNVKIEDMKKVKAEVPAEETRK